MFQHNPKDPEFHMAFPPPASQPPIQKLKRKPDFWYFWREFETCRRIYGLRRSAMSSVLGDGALRLAATSAMRLDNIVFKRKLADSPVRKPLFIIGHPRSGTTFFHNLLVGTDEMVGFKTWQLFWPALVGRRLIRRVVRARKRFGTTEILPGATGHQMDLDTFEEEEFLFWLRYATPLNTTSLLGMDDVEYPEIENPDQLHEDDHRSLLDYLDGCFRRQICDSGKSQVVAQMHFSTMRLRSLLSYYPDARFIYLVRDPLRTVPSYMTLMLNALDNRRGLDVVSTEDIDRLKARRYKRTLGLYRYFHDLDVAGVLPWDRVMVLRYDDLVGDVRATMDRVREFSGIEFSPELEAHIDDAASSQSSYRRGHKVMDLEQLGISKSRILRDFSFVYDRYGIKPAA